jgi:hypothetical protein
MLNFDYFNNILLRMIKKTILDEDKNSDVL